MKGMRVLLVDETPGRAQLLKSALRESDYEVFVLPGTTANLLMQVRKIKPDVIIIDRNTPDRETLEHVRSVTRADCRIR